MNNKLLDKGFRKEIESIIDIKIFEDIPDRERLSKDFYEYSPILKERLDSCIADIVIRPYSIEAVTQVAALCHKYAINLTVRGSGTGNYGQCVPLDGGVVMHMSSLNQIRQFDSSSCLVTVESGCLLKDLDQYLLTHNRQLRLAPSTWRSASIGGFIAGGSGGVGSMRWGFLRDPGNLIGLEIITVEEFPRKLKLHANAAQALNHAYGTNGILTALTISTAPAIEWQEVLIDCQNWAKSVELLKTLSCSSIDLHLCTLLEKNIVKHLPNWLGEFAGCHRILCLVAPDGVSTIETLSSGFGAAFRSFGPENKRSGSGLRELTWNHTTFHMRSRDSSWTYLQMLLPFEDSQLMDSLSKKWGSGLLWHLESVRQQGSQRLAALPVVRWQGRAKMDELIEDCRQKGAIIFNPHVITVEDGGLGVVDADQVEAKRVYDPKGLLNPGKLKGWK